LGGAEITHANMTSLPPGKIEMLSEIDKTDSTFSEQDSANENEGAPFCELLAEFRRHKANMKFSALALGLTALQLQARKDWLSIKTTHAADISSFALEKVMLSAAIHRERQHQSRTKNKSGLFGLLSSYEETSEILDAAEGFVPDLKNVKRITTSNAPIVEAEFARVSALELLTTTQLEAETAKRRFEKDVLRLEKRLDEEMLALEKAREDHKSRIDRMSKVLFDISDQLKTALEQQGIYSALLKTERERTTARQPPTDLGEIEREIAGKKLHLERFLKPEIETSFKHLDRAKKRRQKASGDLANVNRKLRVAREELAKLDQSRARIDNCIEL
jgi:hypothetical protein